MQVEDWNDCHHIPVARYEENLFVVEAYNDPRLQPVVAMKKLDETRYFDTTRHNSRSAHKNHFIIIT